jgi:hypothetical protein
MVGSMEGASSREERRKGKRMKKLLQHRNLVAQLQILEKQSSTTNLQVLSTTTKKPRKRKQYQEPQYSN